MHRILFLDDDADLRELLCEELTFHGYSVETVENGAQGSDLIAKKEFNLFIVDMNMPHVNGVEFLAKARRQGIMTSAILFSGHFDEASMKRAEGIQPCLFVHKSGSIEQDLLPAIRSLLS